MRVALACAPLPGIRAREVARYARAAWERVRVHDEVRAFVASDGVACAFVGSGLEDVCEEEEIRRSLPVRVVELGESSERRFARLAGDRLLLDYTGILDLADSPAPGELRHPHSSALIGEDLAWAVKKGVRQVLLALPVLSSCEDLGFGLLQALVGGDSGKQESGAEDHTKSSHISHGDASGVRRITEPALWKQKEILREKITQARMILTSLDIVILAPGEQNLLGLSGVARARTFRDLGQADAQELEKRNGEIVSALLTALPESSPHKNQLLVHCEPQNGKKTARATFLDSYSGVGSGIALILRILGARIFPVGDFSVRPRLAEISPPPDLLVYVAAHVGAELPSGLLSASRFAQEKGIPLVLVSESSGLRKGELPELGLHGAYELRPDLAFDTPEVREAHIAELPGLVEEKIAAVARTWGW